MTMAQDDAPGATAAQVPRTKQKLEELASAAALQYSLKNFPGAADLFASASEIQAELNGEMAPENAELLFYYGRALYKVALAKSDVLGNKVVKEEKKKPKAEKKAKKEAAESSHGPASGDVKEETVESKPYFQLDGDETWSDSEEEDDDAEGQGEEEDDFENAYETFEMARVLYGKQLEALDSGDSADKGKGKTELRPQVRAIKEKIADCHAFLAEISMENERFDDAVEDGRQSLALQEELHPIEHENVSEAHYMLSLALELASVRKIRETLQDGQTKNTTTKTEPQQESEESDVDQDLRSEAVKHTDLAIQSLEARLEIEKTVVAKSELSAQEKKEKEAIIKDKTEVLEDLRLRLIDLKFDHKSQDFSSIDPSVFQGLMGGMLGADPAAQKAKLQEATRSANDITGLVKTKKKAKAPAASGDASGSKRKLEVVDETDGKRAKTEDIS